MPRRPKALTQGPLRVLAALLLVDGRALPARDLALIALPWGGSRATAWTGWIPTLRMLGCRIETVDFRGSGYRLLALPPDDLLDDVLVVARQLRREHPTRLWEMFGRAVATCPSRETRSSASSARPSDDGRHVLAGHRTA